MTARPPGSGGGADRPARRWRQQRRRCPPGPRVPDDALVTEPGPAAAGAEPRRRSRVGGWPRLPFSATRSP